MNAWNSYTHKIKKNGNNGAVGVSDLLCWRNKLFAGAIIYLLPFCLVAWVPCLSWSAFTNQYELMFTELAALVSILLIAFVPGLSVNNRKIIFIGDVYLPGAVPIYYVGLLPQGFYTSRLPLFYNFKTTKATV